MLCLWAIWLLLLTSNLALILSMVVWIPDLAFLLPIWYICYHVWYLLLTSIFTLFLTRTFLFQVFLKQIHKTLFYFFLNERLIWIFTIHSFISFLSVINPVFHSKSSKNCWKYFEKFFHRKSEKINKHHILLNALGCIGSEMIRI